MKLITTKEFLISDNSVKEADKKYAKLVFENIKIAYLTKSNEWVITYDKKYLDGFTEAQQIEEIDTDGNPTGNLVERAPQPILKSVLYKPHQVEVITDEQYNTVETMIKPLLGDVYTTAELLKKTLEEGIPIFIEMYGYYGGELLKDDFEIF